MVSLRRNLQSAELHKSQAQKRMALISQALIGRRGTLLADPRLADFLRADLQNAPVNPLVKRDFDNKGIKLEALHEGGNLFEAGDKSAGDSELVADFVEQLPVDDNNTDL